NRSLGFCTVAPRARRSRSDGTRVSGPLLPYRCGNIPQQLSPHAEWGLTAATEMGYRRHDCRNSPLRAVLYRAVLAWPVAPAMDEPLRVFARADTLVFRLRHYPLPAHGC